MASDQNVWQLRRATRPPSPTALEAQRPTSSTFPDEPVSTECAEYFIRSQSTLPVTFSMHDFGGDGMWRRDGCRTSSGVPDHIQKPSGNGGCDISYTVVYMDGTKCCFTLKPDAMGLDLLNMAATYLQLLESSYFGLAYYLLPLGASGAPFEYRDSDGIDLASYGMSFGDKAALFAVPSDATSRRKTFSLPRNACSSIQPTTSGQTCFLADVPLWLQPDKRLAAQCKNTAQVFYFRVRFFVPHPDRSIRCPVARHHYCLQLQQHLASGRLACSFYTLVLLCAYLAQLLMGDAPRAQHPLGASSFASFHSAADVLRLYRYALSSEESQSLMQLSDRSCSLAEPEAMDEEELTSTKEACVEGELCCYDRSADVNMKPLVVADEINPSSPSPLGDCESACRTDSNRHSHVSSMASSVDPGLYETYLTIFSHLRPSGCSVATWQGPNMRIGETWLGPVERPGPNWPYPPILIPHREALVERIARLHKKLRGLSRIDAELRFLECAKKLTFYGVELHNIKALVRFNSSDAVVRSIPFLRRSFRTLLNSRTNVAAVLSEKMPKECGWVANSTAKEKKANDGPIRPDSFRLADHPEFNFSVGICSTGVIIYWGQVRLQPASWSNIKKFSFRSQFFRLVLRDTTSSRPNYVTYELEFTSSKLAWRFYMACIAHHRYFRIGQCNPSSPSHFPSEQLVNQPTNHASPTATLPCQPVAFNSAHPVSSSPSVPIGPHNVVSSASHTAFSPPASTDRHAPAHSSTSPDSLDMATPVRRRTHRGSWFFSCVWPRLRPSYSAPHRPTVPRRHMLLTSPCGAISGPLQSSITSTSRRSFFRRHQMTSLPIDESVPPNHWAPCGSAVRTLPIPWTYMTRDLFLSMPTGTQRGSYPATLSFLPASESLHQEESGRRPASPPITTRCSPIVHLSAVAESIPIRPSSAIQSPILIANGGSVTPSTWLHTSADDQSTNRLGTSVTSSLVPIRPPPRPKRMHPLTSPASVCNTTALCNGAAVSRTPSNVSQTSTGWHSTMGSVHFTCIPVVTTRSIRFNLPADPDNPYGLSANSRIYQVNGLSVPIVPTKTLFLPYQASNS